jgi:hypothetical protein
MPLRQFIDEHEGVDRALVLLNRSQPVQLRKILAGAFERQPVQIEEGTAEEYPENTVLLLDESNEVIAESSLDAISKALLFTNSDAYITGSTPLDEAALPDVLAGLEDVTFRLRGYPRSHKEKLLLIGVSRHIERVAWSRDTGSLRSSFQQLSRISDESGTRRVYRRLGDSGVDVHVYGMGGEDAVPAELDVTAHVGESTDYRDYWFVVHVPPDPDEMDPIALLAIETEGVWDGFFTRDRAEVLAIDEYIAEAL